MLKLRQTMRQSMELKQKQTLNAQMIQSVTFLQYSSQQLKEEVENQLMENITLEKVESQEDISLGKDGEFIVESIASESTSIESIGDAEIKNDFSNEEWREYFDNQGKSSLNFRKSRNSEYDDLFDPDLKSNTRESLKKYLLSQNNTFFDFNIDKKIGEMLIENIDSNGFLEKEIDIFAANLDENNNRVILRKEPILEYIVKSINSEYNENKIDIDDVKEVLSHIHEFSPIGCGAFNKIESLSIQAEYYDFPEHIIDIIKHDFKALANRKISYLKKKYEISDEQVTYLLDDIRDLEPIPGRMFFPDLPEYIEPDLRLIKENGEYKVKPVREAMPELRISHQYKKQLKDPNTDKETREYIQERIHAASDIINALRLRKSTMVRVMETILDIQRDFFYKGIEYLKPMTSKDIAEILDFDESTISRVRSNKYVLTDFGIFHLGYFFSNAVKSSVGDDRSSTTVKDLIKKEIENEDKKKPLSDSKLEKIMKEKYNIKVARRTIANYRDDLEILSSSNRKQFI